MWSNHKKRVLRSGAWTALALVAGGVWLALPRSGPEHGGLVAARVQAGEAGQERPGSDEPISVNTVRPRRDPAFSVSVEQPAYVAAYYQADLMARQSGPVKSITHDIGDRVLSGELLLQIDVPDLEEDVLEKGAVIDQRKSELGLARANLQTAAASVAAAKAVVQVKESEVAVADATRTFRGKELRRFQGLASGPSPAVTQDILDERTQFYEAAVAASESARAMVAKAKADLAEANARLETAQADIQLKDTLVIVARKERDKAQALLGFATIRAPFDGVITHRNVDPGSFVQNASSRPDPLLTLARTDIVTVYMKVPDNYAAFVNSETEVQIQMSSLPGVKIPARVTRFSPSLLNPSNDRTMRVEVDLFNGTAAQHKVFLEKEKSNQYADLKGRSLPLFSQASGQNGNPQALNLLPGQYGKMRLILRAYPNAYLVPSNVVFDQGGASYIFLVSEGKALKAPVEIQSDNGNLVKLVLIEKKHGIQSKRDLKATDEIVISNQGELSDGQTVHAVLVER